MKIGFVGIGIMGKSMSMNLLKSGYALTVWNRTPEKTEAVKDAGAEVAASLAQLADWSDVIITMLNDTPDVDEVILGKDGLATGLSPGKVVVDMSTISPDATALMADSLGEIQCDMLDAPVSGGDIGARNGTLTIMVGGKRQVFEKILPVFRGMGKTIVHCGGHGDGQRVKMINQVLCGLHAVALAEAFTLADRVGLDLEVVHKVVSSGAAGSWALDNYGPRLLQGDLSPGFKLGMQQKDLRIAHETVRQFGEDFSGTELAYRLFTRAKENGWGELGSHALIKLYEESRTSSQGNL